MSEHLSIAALVDYRFGEVDDGDAERLEEHLFACSECGELAEQVVATAAVVAAGVRRGATSGLVFTPSLVARLDAEGIPYRRYVINDGETVACHATHDQAFAVVHLKRNLEGVERVDLTMSTDHYEMVFHDVPISWATNEIVVATPGDAVRAHPEGLITITLDAVRGDEREPLGVFRLNHSRTPPD